ncbi:hypothetical protein RRG08_041937 [Elysia crispata]|uniref:Uncharacterized protein n=1 Tax=Elysia crispata TaxID=231223 RepID=A0AAE1CP76_9GAST|nr:hypothetical protein RRG08_041937 [Elysia crispata]
MLCYCVDIASYLDHGARARNTSSGLKLVNVLPYELQIPYGAPLQTQLGQGMLVLQVLNSCLSPHGAMLLLGYQ